MLLNRREWLAGAAVLVLVGPARAQDSEDARLNQFFERIFQRDLARSPIRQSRLGIKHDQDKWDDISERRQLEDHRLLQQDLRALRRFDQARLSMQAQLSCRMFEWLAGDSLKSFAWRRNEYLLTQMGGIHTQVLNTLVNSHPVESEADARAYIARLRGVEPLMRQLVIEVQRQEAAGVQPPRFVYELTLDPCENVLRGRPFDTGNDDSPLWADFKSKVTQANLKPAVRAQLLDQAEAALRESVRSGYQHLIAHLRKATQTATVLDGVWKLRNGSAYYQWQLESSTTLAVTAADLHALGLREVERLHGEMSALAQRSGFSGTLREFFKYVREDSKFYYPNSAEGRAQCIDDATTMLAEVQAREDDFLGRKPRASVVVKAVEEWRQKSAPKAFYRGPPADGSAPGVFYVNLYDMKAAPKYQLPVILYHEAVPGHHVETVIAHELGDIPRFRRFAGVSAFSEGWGLYSERLAADLGLYRDPYAEFGRLSLELMRACRLVVDTGIHAMHWSRERAVSYLDENMPGSHYDNQREVDRYIVLPGQATSYYVGMSKIVELRERARRKLGSRFDLRSFHDTVLGNGPLPLPVLEEIVDAWIANVSAA
jgi:uncharacterized protein (DUF885 family)